MCEQFMPFAGGQPDFLSRHHRMMEQRVVVTALLRWLRQYRSRRCATLLTTCLSEVKGILDAVGRCALAVLTVLPEFLNS